MSCSSIWLVDNDYIGCEEYTFQDSWLFSPVIWMVLSDKYLPRDCFGNIQNLIFRGQRVWSEINSIMNSSDADYERICWELTNQNIFFTKDKKIISDSIRKFLATNTDYYKGKNDDVGVLKLEHIIKHWNEIIDCIENIDEKKYPYFIFKNTSADDSVETLFCDYNYDTDTKIHKSLFDNEFDNASQPEFIIIENGKIVDFVDCSSYKERLTI